MKTNRTPAPALTDWADRVRAALAVMTSPADYFTVPPAGPAGPADLATLLDVATAMGLRGLTARPADDAAQRLADRVAGPSRRDDLRDLVADLLARIEGTIASALDGGAVHESLVRTADFSELRTLVFPRADVGSDGLSDVLLYVGLLDSLPQGHRLKTILPAAENYLHAGREPALVLGRARVNALANNGPARPWYALSDALTLTRLARQRQLADLADRDERDKAEARKKERDFWSSEIGQLERKRLLLEQLRQKGLVPSPITDDPAVR